MVDPEEFEKIRAQVCASGPGSGGDNLLGMEIDAFAYLGDPAYADDDPVLWHDMEVRRSEGAEWLINGRATGKAEDAESIGAELSQIWEQRLRYNYRSAHTVILVPDSVTLLAHPRLHPGTAVGFPDHTLPEPAANSTTVRFRHPTRPNWRNNHTTVGFPDHTLPEPAANSTTVRGNPSNVRSSADPRPDSGQERAVTTQRPQRSTRSQGQAIASQRATASASGTSRLDLSARTQDCTVTSHASEVEG
jgi:hypothetical protein